MKYLITIFIALSLATSATAQWFQKVERKGDVWLSWGWNRAAYTRSDIRFTGEGYDFTLFDVIAQDRQTAFTADTYFSIGTITIPQTNVRGGFFLTDNLCINLGVDHMKYVMRDYQAVDYEGRIDNPNYASYLRPDGTVFVEPSFLTFEHTDGLNYANAELEYHQGIFKNKWFQWNAFGGGGFGALVPKSNVKLMGYPRHDAYHLSGYAAHVKMGIEVLLTRFFFLRLEGKTGWINMPDIVTRLESASDRASQHFAYAEVDGMFGLILPGKKQRKARKEA